MSIFNGYSVSRASGSAYITSPTGDSIRDIPLSWIDTGVAPDLFRRLCKKNRPMLSDLIEMPDVYTLCCLRLSPKKAQLFKSALVLYLSEGKTYASGELVPGYTVEDGEVIDSDNVLVPEYPIQELCFNPHVLDGLMAEGIRTIPELLLLSERSLLAFPYIGKKGLAEVKDRLRLFLAARQG